MAEYEDLTDGAKQLVDSTRKKYWNAKRTYDSANLDLKALEDAWTALIDVEILVAGLEKVLAGMEESLKSIDSNMQTIAREKNIDVIPGGAAIFDITYFKSYSKYNFIEKRLSDGRSTTKTYGTTQIDDVYRAYLSKEVLRVKKIKEDAETAMREALNSLRAWGVGLV